ncbi:hypothetical protein DAI18_00005 (plasmid) [Microvirgula aerodenitrificans]|uniref:Uncharacterized protein n=2 Tax=Microvirgula aerodenitrificans TaxID=57480 RepID=A0A2U3TGU4_9NEIS|nr:hypothetical protein DAI18_00005 [Microvirgula aerodenitrificans]
MLPSRLRLAAALLVPAAALLLSSGYWWSQSWRTRNCWTPPRQAAEHRAIQLASAVAQQTDTLLQMVDVTLQTLGNEYVDEEFSPLGVLPVPVFRPWPKCRCRSTMPRDRWCIPRWD